MQGQLKLQNISINEIYCLAYLVKSNKKERASFLYRNLTLTTSLQPNTLRQFPLYGANKLEIALNHLR